MAGAVGALGTALVGVLATDDASGRVVAAAGVPAVGAVVTLGFGIPGPLIAGVLDATVDCAIVGPPGGIP
jgi:hypothetical protein